MTTSVLMRIGCIAYYEVRMQWRGRGLLVIMLAITALTAASALIITSNALNIPLDMTQTIVALGWIPLGVTLALLLPLVVADTIPRDAAFGVRELLESTPLTHDVYLAGKLLGVWAATALGLAVVMLLTGSMWWLLTGPFSIGAYLEMWVFGGLSLVIINGGLGTLLPLTQPTRRRAVAVVALVFGVPLVLAIGAPYSPSLLQYFSPLRLPMILYYIDNLGGAAGAISTFTYNDVLLTIAAGMLELIVVWAAVWAWQRWQEAR